jgi:NADP-dependent 3-hydroxy-3-methylglutaryl-CoA reductase
VTVDPKVRLELEFVLGDEPVRCQVLELTECSLMALYPPQAPDLPPGQWLASLSIESPDWQPVRLRVLTLEDTILDAEGRRVILMTTADEQARAGLWTVMDRLSSGQLGPHSDEGRQVRIRPVPQRGVYTEKARLDRLKYVRSRTGHAFPSLEHTFLRAERLAGNIENMIGAVEVPVGLAGPLLFRGENARGLLFAPMATTEGALVASATRGAIAVTRAGGVTTRVLGRQMMRVPLFVFSDMRGAYRFSNWVRDHLDELREQTARVSRHARLLSAEPELRGDMVTVRFLYDTGDAAGQNMSTSCTWHACQWLMQQMKYLEDISLESFFIESGVSGDKKVSFQSLISGRGTRVTAECLLPRAAVEEVLKVTPEDLVRGYELAAAFGVQSGTVGWNINIANMIAAMFTATGQDIACVHESSIGLLYLREAPEGAYASLVLPSLVIGTVGGGTHLPRQAELLQLLGCAGADKVFRLAEIVAGFCLALDLSTLAAIAGGQFAAAHERLGRNRPVRWFTREDLVPAFFEAGVRHALGDAEVVVESVSVPDDVVNTGNSVITELTAEKIEKLIGLIPVRLALAPRAMGLPRTLDVMVKVKPLDDEVILMTHRLAAMCGPQLAHTHGRFKDRLGIKGCHVRELAVYEQSDERFRAYTPVVYGTFRDDSREACVIVMENLTGLEFVDAAADPGAGSQEYLRAAIEGIASIHAIWYGREGDLGREPWLGRVGTTQDRIEMRELWEELAAHAAREFPEWFGEADLALRQRLIETIPEWSACLESGPRTLIHNDFNPRNLAFRREPDGLRLVAYDWELATLGSPQHDLAELLCYGLRADATPSEVDGWVELHRRLLSAATGKEIPVGQWREGFRASLFDLTVNRFALMLAAHTFRHYPFMERINGTLRHLIGMERV